MQIFFDSFGDFFNLFETYFGTKNRVFGLFSMQNWNCERILNKKKWMNCNILAQLLTERIMKIFLDCFGAILSLIESYFDTKYRVYDLFSIKSWNCELIFKKVYETLVTFFAARKIKIFFDSFGTIFILFGTYFVTKNRDLGLFPIKSWKCELIWNKKWV